jgi:hypothetical protein
MKLILEKIDPDQMDIELIAECASAAITVLAPDDDFELVIAGDFVSAIRSRTADEDERETYSTDRTFGEAAARALTDTDPPTIVVTAGIVVQGADPAVAIEMFEHEALHVLTARRGESLSDIRQRHKLDGSTRANFVATAGVAAEEFRVEHTVAMSRDAVAKDFKASLDRSLDAFLDVIWDASDARTAGGPMEDYSRSILTAFANLAVMLAYLAASEPAEFESVSQLWKLWVAPTWPRLYELFNRLSPATEETDVAELDGIVFEIADLLPELLRGVGFALKDVNSETGEFWFGPVRSWAPPRRQSQDAA